MAGETMRVVVVVCLFAALAGCCPPGFTVGENGELGFPDNLTFTRRCGGGIRVPILVGTELCGTLQCVEEADCPEGVVSVGDCYTSSVEGPASQTTDDHCLVVEGAGEIAWHHEPTTCQEREQLGYEGGADTFRFQGIAPEGLRAFDYYPSEETSYAFIAEEPTLDSGRYVAEPRLPADYVPPAGEERRVFIGEPFTFATGLEIEGQRVAWNPDEATLDAVDDEGQQASLELVLERPSAPRVRLLDDEVATLRLHLHDSTVPVTRLKGVRGEDVAGLTIHVIWNDPPGPTPAVPITLYAEVRDRDRELVRAAPVEWEALEGGLVLGPTQSVVTDDEPPAAWVDLEDVCLPPSRRVGERRLRARASVADVSEEVELSWTVPSDRQPDPGSPPSREPAIDEGFEPDPRCPQPACSCSQADSQHQNRLGLVALAGLALLVARRRGHSSS